MSFINVAEWTPRHVVQWLQGLDRCIQPYVQFFFDNRINGTRLLSLTYEDLEKIHITKIGHQEIILDSVDLLRHLHYNLASENLQSLVLKLGCKSRSLFNYLMKETNCGKCENCRIISLEPHSEYDENEENQLIHSNLFPQFKKSNVVRKPLPDKKMCRKIRTFTIASVCDILVSVKQFIKWIDRYSFDHYAIKRQTVLRISIELASTTQRDHFVENPKAIIIYNCLKFANICDSIIQELKDSLDIQPACLEMVPIKRKEDEELGVSISFSYRGVHEIKEIKIQSPAHRCGRIEEGDEIVQINYQTVLAWQQSKVILAMKEYPTKIVLTVKKRPSHSRIAGQLRVLEPTKIPHRQVCIKTLNSPLAFQELAYLLNDTIQTDGTYSTQQQEQQDDIPIEVDRNLVNVTNKFQNESEFKFRESIYDSRNLAASSISKSTICIQNHEDKECCEHNSNQHKQLIEQLSIEKPAKGPVYQMSNKPKKLKRRATIHGLTASNTKFAQSIRIEDLVNLNNTENYCLNLNKSMRKSNLTTMDDSLGDDQEDMTTYKSFNNLCLTNVDYILDDQLNPTIIRRERPVQQLNKRTCSEDDAQFVKRTVSVCYNEVYGVNNEFYLSNNYLSLPKSSKQKATIDKQTDEDEEFNRPDYSVSRHNNATIIKVNSSPTRANRIDTEEHCDNGIDRKNDRTNLEIQITSNEKSKVDIRSNKDSSPSDDSNTTNVMEPTVHNKPTRDGLLKIELYREDAQTESEDCSKEGHVKPKVLRRKKSLNKQAKLIKSKNLYCYQLRNNADQSGWLHYLREELNAIESSQPNFELNLNKQEDVKWKENYLILKHDLLYFYSSDDDEKQPCRIINLPTFELDDDLEYPSSRHVFKIKSQKYRFCFASENLNSLNEWINKFKDIFERKKLLSVDEPMKEIARKPIVNSNFKPKSIQYSSFDDGKQKQYKLTHSIRNLNVNNHLSESMSRSSLQNVTLNDRPSKVKLNDPLTNGIKRFGNRNRSQSCVDSDFLLKYSQTRMMNKEIKTCDQIDTSLPPLPGSMLRKPVENDFQSFNQQNQINQFNEQNQLNRHQEQLNQIKREVPKPQPRISKMTSTKEQNANFVGKIINSFDELSKQCEKELNQIKVEHYSSLRKRNATVNANSLGDRTVSELNKINFNLNSSYPCDSPTKETNPIVSAKEPKYISVLDREYDRLFKEKSPPVVKLASLQTATSKEIQSIYLKQHENPNKLIYSPTDKCNSPSDHSSLSSSSGISSYYSMGQDLQMAYSTNFNGTSPNSKNSSFEHSAVAIEQQILPIKIDNGLLDDKASNEKIKKDKSVQRKSSFNSFRLFGSSKVLSKLSSSSKISPDEDKSKNFLTSPRPKRSFFGLRKSSLPSQPVDNSTITPTKTVIQADESNYSPSHLNRIKSKSSELLNHYHHIDHLTSSLNRPELPNFEIILSSHTPLTPDLTRKPQNYKKPTMGVSAMLLTNKRRSSSVSCDRVAIENAFQMYNEKMNNRVI